MYVCVRACVCARVCVGEWLMADTSQLFVGGVTMWQKRKGCKN